MTYVYKPDPTGLPVLNLMREEYLNDILVDALK